MKILDIPKEGRPRERFLKYGSEALSDAELFAILLRTGSKGEKVIDYFPIFPLKYSSVSLSVK